MTLASLESEQSSSLKFWVEFLAILACLFLVPKPSFEAECGPEKLLVALREFQVFLFYFVCGLIRIVCISKGPQANYLWFHH